MAHGKAWMVFDKKCDPPCEDCSAAHKEYLRMQRLRRGLGTTDKKIDVAKTRERLIELHHTYKLTQVEIGNRVGMTNVQIGRIIAGRTAVVYTSKARRIFKLYNEVKTRETPRTHWKPDVVPADLTRLALRGLAAQGYSRIWLSEHLGININTIFCITADPGTTTKGRQWVNKVTEESVLALVRRVGSSDGGNGYARSRARARGWKPTMYYDELV